MTRSILLMIAALMAAPAGAQEGWTAGYNQQLCETLLAGPAQFLTSGPIPDGGVDRVFLAGRCQGLIHALMTLGPVLSQRYFCIPTGATIADGTAAILEFYQEHPERMGDEVLSVATDALAAK